jgi:ADP-ribose pyrophosphatase
MEPLPWRVLSSRYVLDRSPYMVLREDAVELPNGARIDDYFVFEYPDWVIVLAVTAAQEFVLIRQYRHGIAQVHLELAAGVADAGVSLLENAQRELLEETGFGGGDWRPWMSTSANPGTHTNTAHVFLATGVEKIKEQELEDTEDIAVSVLNAEQMLEALRGGQVFQSMHAAALWRYFAEIG